MTLPVLKENGECRYCYNDCEGEHDFSFEPGFVDICDDCLSNKLAEKATGKKYEGCGE